MNRTEHLLTVLAEECIEVAKEVSKALRFGLDDCAPLTPDGEGRLHGACDLVAPRNRERIALELAELSAMVDWLAKEGVIRPYGAAYEDAYEAKRARVERFMEYALESGALT